MQQTRWQLEKLYTIDDVKVGIATIQEALIKRPSTLTEQVERYQQVARDVEEWSDFIYCLYAEDVTRSEVHPLLEEIEVVQATVRSLAAELDTQIAVVSQEDWETFVADSPYAFFLNERRDVSRIVHRLFKNNCYKTSVLTDSKAGDNSTNSALWHYVSSWMENKSRLVKGYTKRCLRLTA